MSVRISIGDFSRMTHLSVKALRRYHEMGLLEPATVDPFSGYRYYEPAQVPVGQVIRRFRDLGMPLEQVRDVLQAPDVTTRNEVIVAHLRQMESALDHVQQTVASLRALLEGPRPQMPVEYRSVGATGAMAISEAVDIGGIEAWWAAAFEELHQTLRASGATRIGPDGALYPADLFEHERGDVVAFIPVRTPPPARGRLRPVTIPAAELAVTVHQGPFSELDQAYATLGTFVTEREIGVEGPIREHYLVGFPDTDDESRHRTEVCWPVFRTRDEDA
jgi:DNA-binding transcriptional MerR regulator